MKKERRCILHAATHVTSDWADNVKSSWEFAHPRERRPGDFLTRHQNLLNLSKGLRTVLSQPMLPLMDLADYCGCPAEIILIVRHSREDEMKWIKATRTCSCSERLQQRATSSARCAWNAIRGFFFARCFPMMQIWIKKNRPSPCFMLAILCINL